MFRPAEKALLALTARHCSALTIRLSRGKSSVSSTWGVWCVPHVTCVRTLQELLRWSLTFVPVIGDDGGCVLRSAQYARHQRGALHPAVGGHLQQHRPARRHQQRTGADHREEPDPRGASAHSLSSCSFPVWLVRLGAQHPVHDETTRTHGQGCGHHGDDHGHPPGRQPVLCADGHHVASGAGAARRSESTWQEIVCCIYYILTSLIGKKVQVRNTL